MIPETTHSDTERLLTELRRDEPIEASAPCAAPAFRRIRVDADELQAGCPRDLGSWWGRMWQAVLHPFGG